MVDQKRAWRVARVVPEGTNFRLLDPELIVIALSEKHANEILEWHAVVGPTWVLDGLRMADQTVQFLSSYGNGLYLIGCQDEKRQAYRYNVDTSRPYSVGTIP